MRILIFPREGIREPEISDTNVSERRRKRLAWRRSQIDEIWRRLATELALTNEARMLAERRLVKMPAVGALVIHDSVATLERLQARGWLLVFVERPLPRPMMAMPMSGAAPAVAWHLPAINKPGTLDGNQVSIGVIDSGCSAAYSDLAAFAPKFKRFDPATETLVNAAPSDASPDFHGSKVCSLLAGSTNGVAKNAMYLVAGIASTSYGTTQIAMAEAFEWFLTEPTGAHPDRLDGVDVITTSLHTNWYQTPDSGDVELVLLAAEQQKTLVISAIGNGGGSNWQPPGSFSTVIGVGASDVNRDVWYSSADGKPTAVVEKPDMLAPGVDLTWPMPYGSDIGEGTSFSAPIVAGAAALILQKRPILRDNVVKFRHTVLSFTSGSTAQGTIRGGRGICDLHGL